MKRFYSSGLSCLAAIGLAAAAQAEVLTRVALLTGSQEVGPVATPATGCARLVIDTDANTLTYRIAYQGLVAAETAAHIHGVAGPGVNAGVLVALPAGNPKVGVWNYPEVHEANILNGLTYINIHSAAFPGGEIRGQIVSAIAYLDAGQEVPPNPSGGVGVGLFNFIGNTLQYYIIYGGLGAPETAAHIHGMALPGTNAGIVHPLPAANPKVGSWGFTSAQRQQIIDGMTYVNIHTTAFPGGEIRGQIVTSVNPMDGQQETPPIAVPGAGCGFCSLSRTTNTLGYDVRFAGLVAAETAAHIHGFSPVGVASGVVNPLALGSPKRGTWAYGAGNFNNIFNALTYFNVHSAAFPGGELRGQIYPGRPIPCRPLVSDQPDNTSAVVGATVSLTVAASDEGGGTVSFQWRKGGTALANGGGYSGVNTATLTINPVDLTHAGDYDVVMTNLCGTTLSTLATLTVTTACDGIDFNQDGLFPDTLDIDDFISVFGGGPCSTDPVPGCADIDFNNDGLFPDTLDIDSFVSVFGGGPCL